MCDFENRTAVLQGKGFAVHNKLVLNRRSWSWTRLSRVCLATEARFAAKHKTDLGVAFGAFIIQLMLWLVYASKKESIIDKHRRRYPHKTTIHGRTWTPLLCSIWDALQY